jgi:formylglycine-generating enzyme required for sulfatase activity
MGDPADDPRPPRPPLTPGQPLPRIARFAIPPDDDPPRPKAARSKKRKSSKGDGESSGVLDEATPNLDTYETRRKVRLGIGLAATAVFALVLWFVASRFRGATPDEFVEDTGPQPPPPALAPTSLRAEREAEVALADARAFAQKGDGELSLKRLRAIVAGYPKTAAAEKAREAVRNAEQGLPLFVDVPLVVARPVAPATPEPEPEAVVVAVPPEPPAPGPAEVEVAPPPTPPEPFRDTGLPREHADALPRALPEGFRARPEAGTHASGWPWEITCDKDGGAMVLVPGGTFTMGRDDGPAEERPAHRVTLSTFYIDQHEVTARQFALYARESGQKASPAESDGSASDDRPAVRVRAKDAYEYLRWAGKSLPTEAQWEFAARTIDGRLHPWGAAAPAWNPPRKPGQIDAVMSYPLDLSPYGAFDLAGNVREWTIDWFDPRLYRGRASQPVTDPANPTRPRTRSPEVTIKGGSPTWVTTWRAGMKPDARLPDLGFRGVLPVEQSANPTIPTAPGAPRGNSLVPF